MKNIFHTKNIKYIIFFSVYSLIFFTLSSNIHEIQKNILNFINSDNASLSELLTKIRASYIYILFMFLFIFFICNLKKINFKLKYNILFYLFFFYIFFSFLGLNLKCLYVDNLFEVNKYVCASNENFIFSFHFLFSQFTVILFLFLIQNYKFNNNDENKNLSLLFSIIFCSLLVLFLLLIFSAFSYGGNTIDTIIKFSINSNGAGRYLLILIFLIFSIYFFANIKNKFILFTLFLLLIFLAFYILILDGKFNIISFFIAILFCILFSKKAFLHRLSVFIFLILFALISKEMYINNKFEKIVLNCGKVSKNLDYEKKCIEREKFYFLSNTNRIDNLFDKDKLIVGGKSEKHISAADVNLRRLNAEGLKSLPDENWNEIWLNGRTTKFKFLLKDFWDRNLYLGAGPEYDRSLILSRQTYFEKKFSTEKGFVTQQTSTDAANGFIYSLLSSGIFGGLVYLTIIFYYCYSCIFFYRRKNNFLNQPMIIFCILSTGYLIGRSIIENGFISWGADFLITLACLSYINLKMILKNVKTNLI